MIKKQCYILRLTSCSQYTLYFHFIDLKQLACLGALEIMMSKKKGVKQPGNVVEIKKVSMIDQAYSCRLKFQLKKNNTVTWQLRKN